MKRLALIGLLPLALVSALLAAPPAWWSGEETRILEEEGEENNSAPANMGQLKHVAKQAKGHLDANLPGGAGEAITSLVEAFEPRAGQNYTPAQIGEFKAANHALINLGQLKSAAKPFYERLLGVGYDTKANLIARGYPANWAHNYPWDPQTPVEENYVPANLGQVKMVFSFGLVNFLSPTWQQQYFGATSGADPAADPDGDGLTNLQEYQQGGDPTDYYSQGGVTITPSLILLSGNNQSGAPGAFLADPLVVEVRNSATNALLVNAPVTFTVSGSGGGQIAASTSGAGLASTLDLVTGSNGLAQSYFRFPAAAGTASTIEVTAGSGTNTAQASFTATSLSISQTGLQLWFKADAGVTADGSGKVSQWVDQAGAIAVTQNTTAAQPVLVANSVNGMPGLAFNGSQRLFSSSADVPLNQDWTIIAFGKSNDSSSTESYMGSIGGPGTSGGVKAFGKYQSRSMLGVWNGYAQGGAFPPIGKLGRLMVRYTKSTAGMEFFQNGSPDGVVTISTANSTPGVFIGDVTDSSYLRPWNGEVHEVIAYDRALSDAEAAQVDIYLADKYAQYHPDAAWIAAYRQAVREEVHFRKWDKVAAERFAAFLASNPAIPAAGVTLWLKADAGVATDGSNGVSVWADQSVTGKDLVQSVESYRPSLQGNAVNGKPAIRFDGSNDHILTSSGNGWGTSQFSVMFLMKPNTTANHNQQLGATGIWGQFFFHTSLEGGVYVGTDQAMRMVPGTGAGQIPDGTVRANSWQRFVFVFDNGVGKFYKDGALVSSKTMAIPANWSGFTLGVPSQHTINGDVAEVMVYDRALGDAELAQVDIYLAEKYGQYHPGATWIAPYPQAVRDEVHLRKLDKMAAEKYAALLASNPVFPAAGVTLWLKADAGVATDGSNGVSVWADQSVTGKDLAQSVESSRPSLQGNAVNGKPAIRFDGSNDHILTSSGNGWGTSGFSVMFLMKPSTTANHNQQLGATGIWGQFFFHTSLEGGVYVGTDQAMRMVPGTGAGQIPDGTVRANSWQAYLFVFDNGVGKFYKDGALVSSKTMAIPANWSGFTLGVPSQHTIHGDVAEVMVYDRALSDAESVQLGVYLSLKYGILTDMPPPVITPAGGDFGEPVEVGITTEVPQSVIRYTLDGSEPTKDSPLYTAPLTISGSPLLKASVFLSNGIRGRSASAQFYVGDADHDLMTDAWETANGLDPENAADAALDGDLDGLTNLQEFQIGTNPWLIDTNGDGIADGVSYYQGIDPVETDHDGDTLTNAAELAAGTNPFAADTDGDGVNDNLDAYPLDPLRSTPLEPVPGDVTAPQITLTEPADAVLVP